MSTRGIDFDISLLVAALRLVGTQVADKYQGTIINKAVWEIARYEEIETHAKLIVKDILGSENESLKVRAAYLDRLLKHNQ